MKLVEHGLLLRKKKLEHQLQTVMIQEDTIRNQIQFELIKERERAETKLQMAQEIASKLEAAHHVIDTKREVWNKHLAVPAVDVSDDNLDLDKEFPDLKIKERICLEIKRQVARLTSTEQYKIDAEATIVEVADHKPVSDDNVAAAEPGPKYTLDDPKVVSFMYHKYLGGYIDAVMTYEYRKALQQNYDVDEQKYAFLKDNTNGRNPFQMKIKIGYEYTWRVMCQRHNRPEWDTSLDTRQWVPADFWPMTHDFIPKGTFGGVLVGKDKANKEFMDRQAREQKVAPEAKINTAGEGKQTGGQAGQKLTMKPTTPLSSWSKPAQAMPETPHEKVSQEQRPDRGRGQQRDGHQSHGRRQCQG